MPVATGVDYANSLLFPTSALLSPDTERLRARRIYFRFGEWNEFFRILDFCIFHFRAPRGSIWQTDPWDQEL